MHSLFPGGSQEFSAEGPVCDSVRRVLGQRSLHDPASNEVWRGAQDVQDVTLSRCPPPWLQRLPTQGQNRPNQIAHWASDSVKWELPSRLTGAVGSPGLPDGNAVGLVVAFLERPRLFAPM